MTHKTIHGYKGFAHDMTCRGFQYEPGKVYEMNDKIEPCKCGFHFCRNAADVFNYYGGEDCRYAEVEAFGDVIDVDDKSVTSRICIVRELTMAEILEIMYAQEGLDFEDVPFPTDEIVRARENGTLGEMLPSGTEFPVTFTNGEKNILVVCRDEGHTYLVTEYLMGKRYAMNDNWTNEGSWPACGMRKHVQGIYDMLPEDVRKVIVPIHIRQTTQGEVVECDDLAFLLSAVNVFGNDAWAPEADCDDTQIDIFQKPANMIKQRVGAPSASWWWLRSASTNCHFYCVGKDGICDDSIAISDGGVVVAFCVEDRTPKD